MGSVNKHAFPMKMSNAKQRSIFPYFLIYYLHIIQSITANKEVLELVQPSKCKDNEYFNTILFLCVQCDANKNLKPSPDRLGCMCNGFSRRIDFKFNYPICKLCGINTTVTTDGRDCISCSNTTCTCGSNEIQSNVQMNKYHISTYMHFKLYMDVDRSLNGTLLDSMHCLTCPNNTYPFLDRSRCSSCRTIEYNSYRNNNYVRKYYYEWIKEWCLNKNMPLYKENSNNTFKMQFQNQIIDSYYLRSELEIALYFCKRKDIEACEHLSNMCVLSLYSNNAACILFKQVQNSPIWLFYDKNDTTAINSEHITQEYSLIKYSNANTLNFVFSTYSLQGTFKPFKNNNIPCNLLENVRFGINVEKKCKILVKQLIQERMEFMSPYLQFVRNNNIFLHALPVLIKNINQDHINSSDWQLVRRFFIFDNISGFKALSNITVGQVVKANKLSAVRYMKSLSIVIGIQSSNNKNRIFPPLMIIDYAELSDKQIDQTLHVTLDFKIKFAIRDNEYNANIKIIIGLFLGLAFILSAIKSWIYSKQHHICIFSLFLIIRFLIYAMGITANFIILCLISLCLYLFMFYKGQMLAHVLVPEGVNEKTVIIFTVIAFIFKFLEVLQFISQYWIVEVFFIDWEQPKTLRSSFSYDSEYASISMPHANKYSKSKYKNSQSSKTIATKHKADSYKLHECSNSKHYNGFSTIDKYKCGTWATNSISNNDDIPMPVSIWRTYFIAKQWLSLQTKRKINVMVQLLATQCVYEIIRIRPDFLTIPELAALFSGKNNNFILYYTMCIVIYTLIYCTQWFINITFYKQFIRNRMQVFVDLCSTTNISVLVLPCNYYGFYIHGRSVHGFADVDMAALYKNSQMEKDNLSACRGLVPGTTQQTFILSLTETFRTSFNEICKQRLIKGNNLTKVYQSSTTNWKEIFDAELKLKHFLCNFIDHCIQTDDYIIKDRCCFEKFFNVLYSENEKKSVFYTDNSYSFNHVLLYGNEWMLATFEISIFSLIIVLYEDCTLACVITVVMSMLLTIIVKQRAEQNLCNNTLLHRAYLTE